MLDETQDFPKTGGDAVVAAICRASAIQGNIFYTTDGQEFNPKDIGATITIWNANAAEQIEAALAETGWEVRKIE